MDVKKLRGKLNITQIGLAQKCNVTLRTVQNWEAGAKIPAAMEKLLECIEENAEIAASHEQQIDANTSEERFFSVLERQQEIMSRQLEEIAETRKLIQKKDEQIDLLLKLIQQNNG